MNTADFFYQAARQFTDWRVLLDILVFTVFIYLLYRTLRATGTWQIVIGLTIAALGAGLASLVGLRGVEWIFSNFSQVALIACLVIFQPEMRKFLERTTSLLRGQTRDDSAGLASLVEDVLFALVKRGWGGLIVIPGQDSLKQWISEGVLVDAVPSFSLFLSIFDPDSPGHDGAVLLEEGRIARIAVRLPLSETNSLPEVMGTRHHASQGIAEKTDSLVLTVSEERGSISIFEKGRWASVQAPGEIAARILAHGAAVTTGDMQQSVLKGHQWRNAMEAGACFVLACLFWVTVVMGKTQINDMIFTVPVQYTGLQNNLVLEGEVPQEVKLHVEGPTSTLTTLDLSLLKVQVDLVAVSEGAQTVALTEENVRGSKKLKILEILPAAIDLQVKVLEQAELPVEPQILGQLPEGLEIQSVEVQPALLQVFIPKSKKKKNGNPTVLRTTPIYLHGLRESTTVYCTVVVPPGIHTPDRRWPDAEVRINVGPKENKAKPDHPIP